jgi:hypothetical protein
VPRVPLRDVVIHAGEQPALEDTQEHARRHQPGVVGHEALRDHGQRPEEHDEGEPDGGAGALHHYVGRDLGGDVEGEEDREAVVVLQAVQVQVLLEVVEARVADVGAVEEAEAGLGLGLGIGGFERRSAVVASRGGGGSEECTAEPASPPCQQREDSQVDERHERNDMPIQLPQQLLRLRRVEALHLCIALDAGNTHIDGRLFLRHNAVAHSTTLSPRPRRL